MRQIAANKTEAVVAGRRLSGRRVSGRRCYS